MTDTGINEKQRFVLSESAYPFLFLLIASIPYARYFVSGAIPLPSPDPHFFYAFFRFHHRMFHEGHIPQWNPYYGMGLDTPSLDPTYNPYRLPNFIGYLFSEPMQGWIFMLIIQSCFIGLFAFKYFKYIGITSHIAFVCGVIYMLTPLHDEFIYQSFWGYMYIFTPILLIILHKYRDGKINAIEGILWIAMVFSVTYLSAGAIGPVYLMVGSFLYILFILIPRENPIKHIAGYVRLFTIGGVLSLGLSAYILYPFIVNSQFMVRPKFIYDFGSFFCYVKQVLFAATTFFIPLFAGVYLDSMDVLSSTVIDFFNYTWCYINIVLAPAIVYVFSMKKDYRPYVYFIVFLFFFVLNTIPFVNLDIFFSGVLKGYGIRKIFMFYSLIGCVIIGFFFQGLRKQYNNFNKNLQTVLKGLFYLYAFLVIGFSFMLLYFWVAGVSLVDVYAVLLKLSDIFHIRVLKILVYKINARVEKVGFYYRCFTDTLWLYYLYYLSIFGMLFVLVKRNRYGLKKCWHWIFVSFIVFNVNILYVLVFPMMESNIVEKISVPPNYDDWRHYMEAGDRVAIYMDYQNALPDKFDLEHTDQISSSVSNTVLEKFRNMGKMTFNEVMEQAKAGGIGTANSAAENLIYLNPFMHSNIALYTSKLHYVYPGGVDYFNKMNNASVFFKNRVKSFARVYQYPYLYDGFDKALVDRMGIRMIFANLPFNVQGMEFVSRTKDGLYIYKNNNTHPFVRVAYDNEDRGHVPVNYYIEHFSDFQKFRNKVFDIAIDGEGEKNLTTTIPYNKHWVLLGDGRDLKIRKDYGLFVGATIPANIKKIEFLYYNTSRTVGLVISAVCLVFWFSIFFRRKRDFKSIFKLT